MRLTKEDKRVIVNNAVRIALEGRRKKLSDFENALAVRGYEECYPIDVISKMNALPFEFFFQTSAIYVRMGERGVAVLNMKSSRRVSAADNAFRRPLWKPSEAVQNMVKGFCVERDNLQTDELTLRKEIEILLTPITTFSKLQRTWPEGAPYYRFITARTPVENPPAVLPTKVNTLLATLAKTL